MKLTYTIARYEYTKQDTFLVAFNVSDDTGNSAYIETEMLSSSVSEKSTQEICQLAHDQMKEKINRVKEEFEKNISLKVGYQFVPDE